MWAIMKIDRARNGRQKTKLLTMSMTMSTFVTGTVLNKKVIGAGNATVRIATLIIDHFVHEVSTSCASRTATACVIVIMHCLTSCRLVPHSGPTRPCGGL